MALLLPWRTRLASALSSRFVQLELSSGGKNEKENKNKNEKKKKKRAHFFHFFHFSPFWHFFRAWWANFSSSFLLWPPTRSSCSKRGSKRALPVASGQCRLSLLALKLLRPSTGNRSVSRSVRIVARNCVRPLDWLVRANTSACRPTDSLRCSCAH